MRCADYCHWRVCPFEPNRVWYSVKYIGSNDGPVLGQAATFKKVESPVQAHSITFNERGEVAKFTIGYVLDKETGNTGGLGGVFGLFYAIGYALPFPEAGWAAWQDKNDAALVGQRQAQLTKCAPRPWTPACRYDPRLRENHTTPHALVRKYQLRVPPPSET